MLDAECFMCVYGCFCAYSKLTASGTFRVVNRLISKGQRAHKEVMKEKKESVFCTLGIYLKKYFAIFL